MRFSARVSNTWIRIAYVDQHKVRSGVICMTDLFEEENNGELMVTSRTLSSTLKDSKCFMQKIKT